MGDLIADAQLAAGKKLDPETDLALMNPGGVRAPLTYAAKGSEGDGVVTYAEGFTVQPFSNTVNLQNFTGAQLVQILKEQVKPHIKCRDVSGDEKIAKVSVVGMGMRSHAGIAAQMFRTLAEEGINIQMISTSEIKITVVIEEKYTELAVRVLHKAFELDQE